MNDEDLKLQESLPDDRPTEELLKECVRSCSEAVVQKLPQELQDMVYSYLWEDYRGVDHAALAIFAETGLKPPTRRPDIGRIGWEYDYKNKPPKELPAIPNFANPDYVDLAFAKQVVIYLYCHKDLGCGEQPVFSDLESVGLNYLDLRVILTTDVFRVGLTPMEVTLPDLTIRIDIPEYTQSASHVAPFQRWNLETLLAPLLDAEFKPNARLYIDLFQFNPVFDLCPLPNFLRQLKAFINSFKHKHKIEVICSYKFMQIHEIGQGGCIQMNDKPTRYGWRKILDMNLDMSLSWETVENWKIFLMNTASADEWDSLYSIRATKHPDPTAPGSYPYTPTPDYEPDLQSRSYSPTSSSYASTPPTFGYPPLSSYSPISFLYQPTASAYSPTGVFGQAPQSSFDTPTSFNPNPAYMPRTTCYFTRQR